MRRALVFLLLAGCNQNRRELADTLRAEEARLAELKSIADGLTGRMREMSALEARLQAALDGRPIEPTPQLEPWKPMPPKLTLTIPEPGALETDEEQRLREKIVETQKRSAELEKVIGEVNNIEKRRAEVLAKLQQLEQLRRGAAADAGLPQ